VVQGRATWTTLGSTTITMGSTVFIGVAVTSDNATTTAQSSTRHDSTMTMT